MIVIVGAGITGLSIAYHLKKMDADFIIIEKEKEPGGLCRSIQSNNYIFDYTGHFLHGDSPYVTRMAIELVPDIMRIERQSYIYLDERFIPYPFQAHLHYLPIYNRIKSIIGYLYRKRRKPENLEGWILTNFGIGMAEKFFFPYNRKLWQYPLNAIVPDFLSPFVPTVNLAGSQKDLGYNVEFLYPAKGIGEFTAALALNLPIFHGEVKRVDEEEVHFEKGKVKFDYLINTVPLPELLKMLELPKEIPSVFESLKWNSVLAVNIGVKGELFGFQNKRGYKRKVNPSGFHWIYFPEGNFPFYRVGSFSNVSSDMAPEGHSSLWVEISYSGEKPDKKVIERTIDQLSSLGFFEKGSVDHILPVYIPYAYPVYTMRRENDLKVIKDYLSHYNIRLAGRFGGWKYTYMEESILEGKRIAEELCQ
ncbi:FAD-dependent oxidoreductase [candidate division WOR-3 bacterium]|nr:FAD-dependent oxidoreductase [candidate division WOR-3 bacterium]